MKKVKHIMSASPVCLDMNENINEIERLIKERTLSFFPVVNQDQKCIGVLSEINILHWKNLVEDPKSLRAWEICSAPISVISPDDELNVALKFMIDNRVNHLVVMLDDRVEGVVSWLDLMKHFIDDNQCECCKKLKNER